MSFSSDVKDELTKKMPAARHCQMAELAAMFRYCGRIGMDASGVITVGFASERESIVRKGFTLLKKTFNINDDCRESDSSFKDFIDKIGLDNDKVNPIYLKNSCCKRAFLRGAFLSSGSISDPAKGYHMEFVCETKGQAKQLQDVIHEFEIDTKIVLRRGNSVVYIKEGESIALLLNIMEAPNALMDMENARIFKEVNNSVNRRVNCEMSNIRKTVGAATRQIQDIEYLRDVCGLDGLPDSLKEMALVRLEYPEVPLQELGEHLDPPMGKSGVNHRLRRLGEMADKLRKERGEA